MFSKILAESYHCTYFASNFRLEMKFILICMPFNLFYILTFVTAIMIFSSMPTVLIHGCDNKAHALSVNLGSGQDGRRAGRVK